jgi:hypothetical protein
MMSSCEHGNEPSGSIKGGEFLVTFVLEEAISKERISYFWFRNVCHIDRVKSCRKRSSF